MIYYYILNWSYLYKFLLGWLHRNQGKGMLISIGAGNEESMDINFWILLLGTTIKGCLFGGIKVQSDIPLIANKCINKVNALTLIYLLQNVTNHDKIIIQINFTIILEKTKWVSFFNSWNTIRRNEKSIWAF